LLDLIIRQVLGVRDQVPVLRHLTQRPLHLVQLFIVHSVSPGLECQALGKQHLTPHT